MSNLEGLVKELLVAMDEYDIELNSDLSERVDAIRKELNMVSYLIDGARYTEDEFYERLNYAVSQAFNEDEFDEYLNDDYSVDILGFSFDASEVLKEMDYSGYDDAYNSWLEDKQEEAKDDLNSVGFVWVYDYKFEIKGV